jgi:hypothetical protein
MFLSGFHPGPNIIGLSGSFFISRMLLNRGELENTGWIFP